jgi:hypothetical protein
MVAGSLTFLGAARMALWINFFSLAVDGCDADAVSGVAGSAENTLGNAAIASTAATKRSGFVNRDMVDSFRHSIDSTTWVRARAALSEPAWKGGAQ